MPRALFFYVSSGAQSVRKEDGPRRAKTWPRLRTTQAFDTPRATAFSAVCIRVTLHSMLQTKESAPRQPASVSVPARGTR